MVSLKWRMVSSAAGINPHEISRKTEDKLIKIRSATKVSKSSESIVYLDKRMDAAYTPKYYEVDFREVLEMTDPYFLHMQSYIDIGPKEYYERLFQRAWMDMKEHYELIHRK